MAARRRWCTPIRSRSNGRRRTLATTAGRRRSAAPASATSFGLPPNVKLCVGVERLDYTKGILDRFHALGRVLPPASRLDRPPGLPAGRGAQPRARLPAYQQLHQECLDLSPTSTSATAATATSPIILLDEHHDQDELFELYRAADVCVVSSLHDGMNLVAKEFVAARDDEAGRARPQHLCRRLARIAGGADRQSLSMPSAMGEAFFIGADHAAGRAARAHAAHARGGPRQQRLSLGRQHAARRRAAAQTRG